MQLIVLVTHTKLTIVSLFYHRLYSILSELGQEEGTINRYLTHCNHIYQFRSFQHTTFFIFKLFLPIGIFILLVEKLQTESLMGKSTANKSWTNSYVIPNNFKALLTGYFLFLTRLSPVFYGDWNQLAFISMQFSHYFVLQRF